MANIDVANKIVKANELKEQGNTLYQKDDVKGALRQYHFAWLNIKGLGESAMNVAGGGGGGGGGGEESSLTEEDRRVLKALTESLHLNLAACYLRTEQLEKCIKACTVAIGVNPNSAKGYFRRGQAYLKTRDTDNAEKDVRKASQLAPSDVAIRKQLQKVAAEKKRQNQKQAKTFKGFFDKLEIYDDKDDVSKKARLEEDVVQEDEPDEPESHEPVVVAPPVVAPVDAAPAASSNVVVAGHSDPGRPD